MGIIDHPAEAAMQPRNLNVEFQFVGRKEADEYKETRFTEKTVALFARCMKCSEISIVCLSLSAVS